MRWRWARGLPALISLAAWACALDRAGNLAEKNDDQSGGSTGRGGDIGPASSSETRSSATSSSTTTSTSTGMGGMGGGGQGGEGAIGPVCGDGVVEGAEACDDQNGNSGDGCAGCAIEQGWTCSGQPSSCQPIAPTVTQGSGLPLAIPDDGYNGTMASGACATFNVSTPYTSIQRVRAVIGADHPWIGDLVVKLRSPASTTTTLLSRPGLAEPADDGTNSVNNNFGDASNLAASSPITFMMTGMKDAETMGDNITGGTVCQDDAICTFVPNHGAGPGTSGLDDFLGQDPNGAWLLCIGDAAPQYAGTFAAASLEILAW